MLREHTLRETIMYGHRTEVPGMEHRDTYYHMTHDQELTEWHDPDAEILKLKVTEADHNDEDLDWGWWDNRENRFTYVLYSSSMLEIIFAYGSEVAEDEGQGKKLPVEIVSMQ